MSRLHRPHKPKPKRCVGCGHAVHGYMCTRANNVSRKIRGRRHWCQCLYERPLTKRKRKRYTGARWSRTCMSPGPHPPHPELPKASPRKIERMNRLYDDILDLATEE